MTSNCTSNIKERVAEIEGRLALLENALQQQLNGSSGDSEGRRIRNVEQLEELRHKIDYHLAWQMRLKIKQKRQRQKLRRAMLEKIRAEKAKPANSTPSQFSTPLPQFCPSIKGDPSGTVHEAAACGNKNMLMQHLAKDVEGVLRARDSHGDTPLIVAARNGQVECVQILLSAGADPCVCGRKLQTPLHAVAEGKEPGHVEVVKVLLEAGAKPNIVDAFKTFPVAIAATSGCVEVLDALLSKGASPNVLDQGEMLLISVVREGRFKEAKTLLEHGADPNTHNKGTTVLALAVETPNSIDLVRLLLQRGAHPNIVNTLGETPLQRAAAQGNVALAEALLRGGADPLLRTKASRGVLAEAAATGNTDLIWAIASVVPGSVRGDLGAEALRCAVEEGCAPALRTLLHVGADLNSCYHKDSTALHRAVQCGHSDCLAVLLEEGADPEERDVNGYTPLHLAVQRNDPEAVRVLLDALADPTAPRQLGTYRFGSAPIDFARSDVVRHLLTTAIASRK